MAEQIENFDFSTKAEELAGKYLTFALSDGHYGVEILNIQEIIGVIHITKVPKSPPYLKGIINLRGNIIPVIDLRLKFNLP
ncbi:MAG: chemotaxis protein CheW, partial [Candidatus Dadabacteria bacterium]